MKTYISRGRSLWVAVLVLAALKIVISGPLKVAPIVGIHSVGSNRQQGPVVVNYKDDDWLDSIKRGIKILGRGITGFIAAFPEAQRLEEIRKKGGDNALSFSDYQFLKRAGSDKWKFLRMLVTIPISPELFFYSYVVFPMISAGNPWAWQSLLSTFDDEQLFKSRQSILTKRRMQAVVSSLLFLKSETLDDVSAKKRAQRERELQAIHTTLKSKASLEAALNNLACFFEEDAKPAKKNDNPKKKKSDTATLSALPGSVLKDLTRCFGVDGPPNLPLIRRLNEGEVQSQLDKVRDSDTFLREAGVARLSSEEARVACIERFISVEKKSSGAMRADLTEWLRLVGDSSSSTPTSSSPRSVRANAQNKRLALMALHAVRDLDKSEFGREYRLLLR